MDCWADDMSQLPQPLVIVYVIFIHVVDSSSFFNKQFNKMLTNAPITSAYSTKGVFGCEKMCLEFGRQCAAVNVRQSLNNGFTCEIISEANIPTSITAEMMGPNPMGKFILKTDDVDNCSPDPCLNGATCYDIGRTFRCECASSYAGNTCQLDTTDTCGSSPCQNGGTCTDVGESYTCTCGGINTGINCESVIDICDPDPCQNSGTCVADGLGGYTCTCPPSHTGNVCETVLPFDCTTNNPCYVNSPPYFTHADYPVSYIQCNIVDDRCFILPCSPSIPVCI